LLKKEAARSRHSDLDDRAVEVLVPVAEHVVDKLVGCTPKAGGGPADLDCTHADVMQHITLGAK